MTYRNRPLLDSVRDLPCQSCGADDGTIVPAHSNTGKGMGIKASDATVMALCHRCHAEMDQGGMPKVVRRAKEYEYSAKTLRLLIEMGVLVVR